MVWPHDRRTAIVYTRGGVTGLIGEILILGIKSVMRAMYITGTGRQGPGRQARWWTWENHGDVTRYHSTARGRSI